MRSYANRIEKVKEGSVVTLLQAKQQLNVEETFVDDDEHILFLIESATAAAEDQTGIDIALTTNTLEYINFSGESMYIQEAPYKDIVSITTTTDNVDTLLDSADYTIQYRRTDFIIIFNENITADKIVFVFHTGWDTDDAPYSIQSAILIKINSLYDVERSNYTSGSNFKDTQAFERLLSSHSIYRW